MFLNNIVFISDKIYIPQGLITDIKLLRYWEFIVLDETIRSRFNNFCEMNDKKDKNHRCRNCPGYIETLKLWGEFKGKNGINYYYIPAGKLEESLERLKIDVHSIQIVDKRCKRLFANSLEFTGKLKTGVIENGVPTPNQVFIVDDWLRHGRGIIQAPPRTGKTIICTAIACKLKLRTLIVANQEELLQNFYGAFENFTNLKELREQTGKEIVRIIQDVDEITDDLDVVLITYQKFIRKESRKGRIESLLKDKFGMIAIDECHTSASREFSRFIYQLNPYTFLGLSATPDRKDCVTEDTKIWTEVGAITIKELYNRKEKGENIRVYSTNQKTKEIELKTVLEFHKVESNRIRRITLEKNEIIEVTSDHEFL